VLAATLLALLQLTVLSGAARADDQTAARQAYVEGRRQYNLGQYQAALEAFKQAYLKYESPAFLYNIAQCHKGLGQRREAIDFYQRYLRLSENPPDRPEVEQIIATLRAEDERAKEEDSRRQAQALAKEEDSRRQTLALAAEQPPVTHAGRQLKLGGLVVGGVGIALLAGGVAFAVETKTQSDAVNAINNNHATWDPSKEHAGLLYQDLEVAFLAVGGAALVAGIVTYAVGAYKHRHERASLSPSLARSRAASKLVWSF
jgi:tetratricopeptide (TPR) repeat protein